MIEKLPGSRENVKTIPRLLADLELQIAKNSQYKFRICVSTF